MTHSSRKPHIRLSGSLIFILLLAGTYLVHIPKTCIFKDTGAVIRSDKVSYYDYLPAYFIEHDIAMHFLDQGEKGTYWPELLPNGNRLIKTTMGVAICYAPFFGAAHQVALSNPHYEADGFSWPYACAILLSGIFWTVLGCLFLRRLLLEHFSEWVTTITLFIIALCTNLFWYTTIESGMSHCYSFGLISLFLLLTDRWHSKPGWGWTIGLGLTYGLITLIRPTNCLVALVFLFYGITSWQELRERFLTLLKAWPKILVVGILTFLVWAPQLAYWKAITGHLLSYSYGSSERFFFGDPKILEGLFSYRKGWLVYTPVMALAMWGFYFLYKHHRQWFWPLALYMTLNLYVIFSWWCWWYGGSLGLRALIDCYGLLSLPLAAFLNWVGQSRLKAKIPLIVLTALLAYQSSIVNIQYYHGLIHWDSMTGKAFWNVFGHTKSFDGCYDFREEPDYAAAQEGIRGLN